MSAGFCRGPLALFRASAPAALAARVLAPSCAGAAVDDPRAHTARYGFREREERGLEGGREVGEGGDKKARARKSRERERERREREREKKGNGGMGEGGGHLACM